MTGVIDPWAVFRNKHYYITFELYVHCTSLLSAASTDWAFYSPCLNDSGSALHSSLAYDLNTTVSTTTEPWESLALERGTSHSRASTPRKTTREKRARDHHLCLLRPITVSPLNPLHDGWPPSHHQRLPVQHPEQMQWHLKDWQFCF